MQTPIIKYNLRDRGRQFRGKPRNFNVPVIVKAINSPACQEKVHNRDMLGFYGHWPRMKFGMNPMEGGIEKGRPAFLEPALVTIHLKAYPDGTIEHQEEFLDTDSGKLAAKLFRSRVGGFSSVIGNANGEFFGFDYVNEPNYSTNRGYSLDSVAIDEMTDQEVEAAIRGEQISGVLALLDGLENDFTVANETIEHLKLENEQLLSMLAAKGIKEEDVKLDAVGPTFLDRGEAERLQNDIMAFRSLDYLPRPQEPASAKEVDLGFVANRLLKR